MRGEQRRFQGRVGALERVHEAEGLNLLELGRTVDVREHGREVVEGRPARVLTRVAQVVIRDGGHAHDGLVPLDLAGQSRRAGEKLIRRREPITCKIEHRRKVARKLLLAAGPRSVLMPGSTAERKLIVAGAEAGAGEEWGDGKGRGSCDAREEGELGYDYIDLLPGLSWCARLDGG